MNAAPVIPRIVEEDGWTVELDLSPQVLRVEAPERVFWSCEGLALSPTLPRREHGAVSAAALLLKAKQFDDGLYAAVERAVQNGLGRFPGKVTLLTSLASALSEPAAAPVNAAAAGTPS